MESADRNRIEIYQNLPVHHVQFSLQRYFVCRNINSGSLRATVIAGIQVQIMVTRELRHGREASLELQKTSHRKRKVCSETCRPCIRTH